MAAHFIVIHPMPVCFPLYPSVIQLYIAQPWDMRHGGPFLERIGGDGDHIQASLSLHKGPMNHLDAGMENKLQFVLYYITS